ncbi:hypothetical protein ACWJJH_02735 [Endozoicomonadaceae bacterium StTr2]
MDNKTTISLQALLLQLHQETLKIDQLARTVMSVAQQQQDLGRFMGYLGRVDHVEDSAPTVEALHQATADLPKNSRILATALDGYIWRKEQNGELTRQGFVSPPETGNQIFGPVSDANPSGQWQVTGFSTNNITWQPVT